MRCRNLAIDGHSDQRAALTIAPEEHAHAVSHSKSLTAPAVPELHLLHLSLRQGRQRCSEELQSLSGITKTALVAGWGESVRKLFRIDWLSCTAGPKCQSLATASNQPAVELFSGMIGNLLATLQGDTNEQPAGTGRRGCNFIHLDLVIRRETTRSPEMPAGTVAYSQALRISYHDARSCEESAAYCNGQICRKLHIVSLGSAMPVAEVENCWCKLLPLFARCAF
mmetsp:Transcript_128556/g.181358  ORF Transcript_128556/g.181358 Transcript_128556/m.181358 type:complete len:225 (+) Transcript_128556:291-965(+)